VFGYHTKKVHYTFLDTEEIFMTEDEECVLPRKLTVLRESVLVDVPLVVSESDIIEQMFSSSLTTNAILGRSSGSSSEHFRAKFKNFSA
jgi:hypothetical protein